jgi:hypothetical protein
MVLPVLRYKILKINMGSSISSYTNEKGPGDACYKYSISMSSAAQIFRLTKSWCKQPIVAEILLKVALKRQQSINPIK